MTIRRQPVVNVAALSALALLVASCGAGTRSEPPTSAAPETTNTVAVPTVTTATTSPVATTLPGEAFELGPAPGVVLGVVSVAHDDVLNVRDLPGLEGAIIAELDPLEDEVSATGRARLLPTTIWYEVISQGTRGWANASYLAYLGDTDDAASEIVELLGAIPTAETMEALGSAAAAALASEDPPSQITMSVAPTQGDLGEVTFDVLGLGDDAVYGFRLHVFGQPSGAGGFSLHSVQRTLLCGRGVTPDGLCV